MFDALEEHDGNVDGTNITILRFATDIDGLVEEREEQEALCIRWRSVLRRPN